MSQLFTDTAFIPTPKGSDSPSRRVVCKPNVPSFVPVTLSRLRFPLLLFSFSFDVHIPHDYKSIKSRGRKSKGGGLFTDRGHWQTINDLINLPKDRVLPLEKGLLLLCVTSTSRAPALNVVGAASSLCANVLMAIDTCHLVVVRVVKHLPARLPYFGDALSKVEERLESSRCQTWEKPGDSPRFLRCPFHAREERQEDSHKSAYMHSPK